MAKDRRTKIVYLWEGCAYDRRPDRRGAKQLSLQDIERMREKGYTIVLQQYD